ncbi:MAG: MarR family winged helix-turn-helix transcriptional regulator [Pseudomonadota bacterium]
MNDDTITPDQTDAENSPALDFCLRLARAYAVQIRRFDNSLGNHHGLSFGDYMLLLHLNRAPGERLRRVDLAERVGLTASGVTRSLLPLEKIGLIARQTDSRDARASYAVLTPAGKALFINASVSAELVAQDALQSVPPKQLAALSAVLGQLAGMHAGNS